MARRPEWLFDGSPIDDPLGHGERAVRFLRALTHAGTGKPFQLDPWQERLVRMIYGPRWHDGTRKYTRVYAMIPRGARKTGLGAGLAMLHTIGPERIPFGQVHLAACNRKQSKIPFREAQGFVMADRRLDKHVKVRDSQNKITHRKSQATLEAISADAATANGLTSKFVLFDEVHAWRDRRLYDTLVTGLGKTSETLGVVISQAGTGEGNLAHDIFSAARRITDDPDSEPRSLPVIFETLPGDDWRDERVWHVVNPGLACTPPYPNLEAMRQEAREAETRPDCRIRFQNDRLNIWLDRATSPFVEMATWNAAANDNLGEPAGPVWLGVDLSASGDLTSIVMAWRDPEVEGGVYVRPFFFCPAEALGRREEVSGVPYVRWAAENLLTPTPGEVVDLNVIEAAIRNLCDRYDVAEIAFDPALSHGLMGRLSDEGLPVIAFRQGALTMMPAIATAERLINGRKLRHPGHPILDWNLGNIEVETNPLGHMVRFRKPSRHACIDGAVAMTMAVHRCANGEDGKSIYEDETKRPDGPLVLHHEWDFAA
ncbi:terminase TerL endonuclease subunit [Methylopila sp. 73B]|uniref:terminase large subunit n=1 Tax=Methylopila sp. 73B TaxID=1120792 RepID=UPI0003829713|nr:terminase TerL endonuclease subunit [Methylopila sp. 73B]